MDAKKEIVLRGPKIYISQILTPTKAQFWGDVKSGDVLEIRHIVREQQGRDIPATRYDLTNTRTGKEYSERVNLVLK